MNVIVKTFIIGLIFGVFSVAVANTTDRSIGDQVRTKTITMGDQNFPSAKPAETTTQTSDNKDEPAQTQGAAQSEESKVMEQSQSMDESTATNDNNPANQQKSILQQQH